MSLPTIAQRMLSLAPSITVALNARAKEIEKSGAKVVNFTVGELDAPTPAVIVQVAMEALKAGKTRYSVPGGTLDLRNAAVEKLRRDNHLEFNADAIVFGIGAKELLFHIFLSILNDGDEVIVPAPYWVSYPEQIRLAGAEPKIVPMSILTPGNGQAWDLKEPLEVSALSRMATARTKAIVLNSPNNPSGYTVDREGWLALGEFLRDKPWWIVVDEIYEYLSFEKAHFSLLELCPFLKDRYILVNGLSKSFAMTGWRVGFSAGPATVMKQVRGLESHSSTSLPAFIEDAAAYALRAGRPLMEEEIQKVNKKRQLTLHALKDVHHIRWIHPTGAFYVLLDVRQLIGRGFWPTSAALCEHLLNQHHLATVPGEAFGVPGFIRMSYATSEENILEGISRLKAAFNSL